MRTDAFIQTAGGLPGPASREITTYPQLLSQAHEESLRRVKTTLIQIPDEGNGHTAIAKAEVETSRGTFEALGDASPENVEAFLAPHLIRVAETRAKARALRDAVNVGVVSLEELDGRDRLPEVPSPRSGAGPGNGSQRSGVLRSPGRPVVAPRPALPPDTSTMSEGQRRYLFRLMAGRGVRGEAATEALKELFGVGNLSEVTKVAATRAIDQLLVKAGQDVGHA